MNHVYCISGFGADERIFKNLSFAGHEVHFIQWKIPEKKESLQHYAQRLAAEIKHEEPILVGVSFGGMMCIEISKILSTEKIILLSSIKTYQEKPWYMRVAAKTHINKLIPLRPHRFLEPIENYNLGVKTPEEIQLVREYRKNINLQYCYWAIEQILQWKNDHYPQNLVHIHGSNDHLFPLKNIHADFVIPDGGHLMVMNKPAQVNEILKQIL